MPVPTTVEIVHSDLRRGPFRAALFDFDGTLSLIREGWCGLMVDIGIGVLRERTQPIEPEVATRAFLEAEMLRLSGQPSLEQMRRLSAIVQERGGQPPEPDSLLATFHHALEALTNDRKRRLREGIDPPAAWAVPGAQALLHWLKTRGVELYLASGTELRHVRVEADLLGLAAFFPERIYAPAGPGSRFSKREVIERLLKEHGLRGEDLIGFGDGYAETVEVKRVGGVAIGLATVAVGESGRHEAKRQMLIDLGADAIMRDFSEAVELARWLWGEVESE